MEDQHILSWLFCQFCFSLVELVGYFTFLNNNEGDFFFFLNGNNEGDFHSINMYNETKIILERGIFS